MAIRVFLADEHEIVRKGITAILTDQTNITIVGEANSQRAAILRIPTVKPDVAIIGALDDTGTKTDVIQEIRARHPPTAVLILTTTDDDPAIMAAILAGAAGVVAKTITATDLINAITTVAAGRTLLDARCTQALLERARHAAEPSGPFTNLTDAERRVLELLGEGLTNHQIAERIYIAEKSVKNLVSRVLAKLELKSRTQAALAVQHEHDLGG